MPQVHEKKWNLWFVSDISGGGDGVVQDICDGGPQHVHGEVAEAGEDEEPDHRPGPRLGLGSIAQTWTHQHCVCKHGVRLLYIILDGTCQEWRYFPQIESKPSK